MTIVSDSAAPASDLMTRHVWNVLPSPLDADAFDPVAAGLISPGEVNAREFQHVIDNHDKIALPKGVFKLNGTVTLKPSTVLMGVSRNLTRIEVSERWNPASTDTPVIATVSSVSGRTYLGDLSIGVPSRELSRDKFTAVHWEVGAQSMVHIARPYHNPQATTTATTAHSLIKITGNGGGRWYFLGRGQTKGMGHSGYRILTVKDTRQPLHIYGLNMEHAGGWAYAEFTNAANARIYNMKTEYYGETGGTAEDHSTNFLVLDSVTNVALFGATAIRHAPDVSYANILIKGASTKVLVANVIPQKPDTFGRPGDTLRDISTSPVVKLTYPDGVTLYKKGLLDDSVMFGASGVHSNN